MKSSCDFTTYIRHGINPINPRRKIDWTTLILTCGRKPIHAEFTDRSMSSLQTRRRMLQSGSTSNSYASRPWTQDDIQRLDEMKQQRRSSNDMARATGRSFISINHQLARIRLPHERRPRKPLWTKSEDEMLLCMKADGASWTAISGALSASRTVEAVRHRYFRIRDESAQL